MNQKMLMIVSVVLAATLVGSVAANLFLFTNNSALQNDYNTLNVAYDNAVDERDKLVVDVATVTAERDDARSDLEDLNMTYNSVVYERDTLSSQLDAMTTDRNAIASERDSLKTEVSTLVTERDTARTNEEVLQGQVTQLTSDLSAVTTERDDLKTEVSSLIVERDAAKAEADNVRLRMKLINHHSSDNGVSISFGGYCVNTGIENFDISVHVTGYDLTGELVIDLYVQNWTVHSNNYIQYADTITYSPLILSSYSVELLWGNQLTTN